MEKVLMIFEGQHCAPCKAMDMELQNAVLDVAEIQVFEDSQHIEVFKDFNVRSVPTMVLMQGGEEVARCVGFRSRNLIESFVNGTY